MRDRSQKPSIEAGVYRHFKGSEYTVTGEILPDWSEGKEDRWLVEYVTALGERGVREFGEFTGVVFRDGESKQRFTKIK